jgi:hypothetical protein
MLVSSDGRHARYHVAANERAQPAEGTRAAAMSLINRLAYRPDRRVLPVGTTGPNM